MSDRYTEREWLEGLRYEDKFPDDEYEPCEFCNGLGGLSNEWDDTIVCPTCNGTGTTPITTSAGSDEPQ